MTKLELAYCAGVIDSDGTIGIRRMTYAMRVVGDSKAPTYSERIAVKQVEPQAVDMLHRLFGGSMYMNDPSAKRGRPLHSWVVTDRKAAFALKSLLPFLRIKSMQAKNCLALRELKERSKKERVASGRGHAGSSPRTEKMSAAMDRLYQVAHDLNRVGI